MEERFWEKVQKRDGQCWEWTGAKTGGYGMIRDSDGRGVRAHRKCYELLVGPIPDGWQIDHLCRNPGCVNPDHLEPVTQRENVLRGIGPTAKNAAKERCHLGHEPNWYIRPDGGRFCRECGLIATRKYQAKIRTR